MHAYCNCRLIPLRCGAGVRESLGLVLRWEHLRRFAGRLGRLARYAAQEDVAGFSRRAMLAWVLMLVAAFASLAVSVEAAKDGPKDCEICVRILDEVEKQVGLKRKEASANKVKFNAQSTIEKLVDEVCNEVKTQAEKKVCYYLTPVKRKISQPMSNYMPADRVCKKLKAESPELCEVREAIKIEKGKTDYTAMRVKDLKKILATRGVTCNNCLEKAEFIKRCEETEDMHDEL